MRSLRTAALSLLFVATAPAAAILPQPLQVFPANPVADAPFLILIEDTWNDGCGGSVETELSSDRIDITAVLASPILGAPCPAVILPFQALVNPDDVRPGFKFDETVTVTYSFDAGAGPVERASEQVTFSTVGNAVAQVQDGGWITPKLESSGLFVDQQGDILTVMLSDYDESGRGSWHYAAGRVNGNVFSAELLRFTEIVCVTEPCARAAPDGSARINVLLRGRDELLVTYDGALLSGRVGEEEPFTYRHLRFNRDPSLGDLDVAIPDLTGTWVAGVRGVSDRADDLRTYEIAVDGVDFSNPPQFVFRATAVSPSDAAEARTFNIRCADFRPVDGGLSCSVEGFAFEGLDCFVDFDFNEVGHDRISAPASCDTGIAPEARFEFFRVE